MSTNIRFENPADGSNNWPNRKNYIADIISRNKVHILGSQEGREGQIRELSQLIPHLTLIDQHRDWIKERMYPALFIDLNKFKVLESGDIWLSKTPDLPGSKLEKSAFPRLSVYSYLKEKKTGQYFFVFNCHLDHIEESTRVEQMSILINEINKVNTEESPVILMGDFNAGPNSPVRELVNNSNLNLVDPWIKLGLEEESSFHKFDGIDPTGEKLRIDWILLNSTFKNQSIQIIKENRNGSFPSDHFFIKASFS